MTANSGGIDWTNNEAVVRAAVPDAAWYRKRVRAKGGSLTTLVQATPEQGWREARFWLTVQAFERSHNPAHVDSAVVSMSEAQMVTPGQLDWQNSTEGLPDGMERATKPFDWATATAEEKVRRRWPDAYQGLGAVYTFSPDPHMRLPECLGYGEGFEETWEKSDDSKCEGSLARKDSAKRFWTAALSSRLDHQAIRKEALQEAVEAVKELRHIHIGHANIPVDNLATLDDVESAILAKIEAPGQVKP